MAKKVKEMTSEQVLDVMKAEHLNFSFAQADEPVREPNTVGVCRTATGRYMAYCIDANSKMFNTSVHERREQANHKCVERMRTLINVQRGMRTLSNAPSSAEVSPVLAEEEHDNFDLNDMSFDNREASAAMVALINSYHSI